MTDSGSPAKSRMKCREIMTKSVRTASPTDTIRQVAELMRDGDMGAVPILDHGKLVGIVTDRDIVVRSIAEGVEPASPISKVMSGDLSTVTPDDFVFTAIRLMGDRQVRRIPVVDDEGGLAGIISMADIALETEDELEIAEALEEISSGSSFWGKR
ncbi:MAG: CBS domain-containing protein [Pyrinomonadaceae bacterium]|nr:CBS domain-containing protein [Pyrinomonadaceae bacterium]